MWGDFDKYSSLNVSIRLQARHTVFSGMFSEGARSYEVFAWWKEEEIIQEKVKNLSKSHFTVAKFKSRSLPIS